MSQGIVGAVMAENNLITAAINNGNSGGAAYVLENGEPKLLGIPAFVYEDTEGIGGIIKIRMVRGFLNGEAGKNKTRMRRNDVNLERKLWMWGYITTAENSLLEAEIRWLRKEQGGEITNTLAIERELAVAP